MISFLGVWISPIASGDRPPPCFFFSLTSLTDNTFIMFGGKTADGQTDAIYIGHCTKSTIVSSTTYSSLHAIFLDMGESQSTKRNRLAL